YPHADAVLRAGPDVVSDLLFRADDFELPPHDDRGEHNAHLVIGQVRAQAAAMATAERQELERIVLALDETVRSELVWLRIERWILSKGADPPRQPGACRQPISEQLARSPDRARNLRQDRVKTQCFVAYRAEVGLLDDQVRLRLRHQRLQFLAQ